MTEGRVACLSTIHFYIILKRAADHECWLPWFEYHTFLHHSQTEDFVRGSLGSFEYHTFLHHSQTQAALFRSLAMFEYHTFLHHSQTMRDLAIECLQFEYHTFLHHSQTIASSFEIPASLSTIHFYIILKREASTRGTPEVWVPYIFTSFSNEKQAREERRRFEYHTFLHHSQTIVRASRVSERFEYHTFLHHSQTIFTRLWQTVTFEYHTFLHHSQTPCRDREHFAVVWVPYIFTSFSN